MIKENLQTAKLTHSFSNIRKQIEDMDYSWRGYVLNFFALYLCAFILAPYSSPVFAHGETSETVDEKELVEHAKQDAYWAELAQSYPPYVLPQQLSRVSVTKKDRTKLGKWGEVIDWPHIPVTAANLPDGRILTFASNLRNKFTDSRAREYTYAATWDPKTNTFVENNHPSHDMFCAHLGMLEDGRVIINGGTHRVTTTSIFNYKTDNWESAAPMSRGRWYPTTIVMPDNSVFTAVGTGGGEYPELWTEANGWKVLTGASLQEPILDYTKYYESDWWPLLNVDPKGKIFHSGPTPKMHTIDTSGLGSIKQVGPEIHDWYPKHGSTVMYDKGKLLVAGGAIAGNNQNSTNKSMLIDINGAVPVITPIDSMQYPRKFHNGVILPTGEVLMVGGNTSGLKFSDRGTILPSEIWNPKTNKWRTVGSISVPRNYHSIALLLADGRVLSGGGGLCACAADHANAQVYSPPYLFDENGELAERPVIQNMPESIKHGQSFTISSNHTIKQFNLIKMSATTHAVNTDLRFLKIPFTVRDGNYQLTMEANKNVLTPGYWMLFAINENGVPSKAGILQIKTQGTPKVEQLADQSHLVGSVVSIQISANDPNDEALIFTAINLPEGLTINSSTGLISGIASNEETKDVTINISNSDTTIAIHFDWKIYPKGKIQGVSYDYYKISPTLQQIPDLDALAINQSGVNTAISLPSFITQTDKAYAVRLTSRLLIDKEGQYQFSLKSTDGSQLWLDGSLLIDNNGLHDTQTKQANIFLTKGQHDLRLAYFNQNGSGLFSLHYNALGEPPKSLAESVLIQSPQHNVAPQIVNVIDQQNLRVNTTVDITIIAVDANGDPLRFIASNLPPGLSLDRFSGHISGQANTIGHFSSTIVISDNHHQSSRMEIEWIISGHLSIEPIVAKPRGVGGRITYQAITNGGMNNQYQWNFGDGSPSTTFSNSFRTRYSFSKPGRYVVTLIVKSKDESGEISQIEYQFTQSIYIRPPSKIRPSVSMSIIYDHSDSIDRIWNVNPDNNSVTVFDPLMHTKITEINVGKQPRSLAKAPDGKIWVVNKDSASISIIDPSNYSVIETIVLPPASQPYGLVISPATDDHFAYVTLQATGKLLQINTQTKTISDSIDLGNYPRHLGINADGDTLYVSRFVTPPLPDENTENPKTEINDKDFGGELLVINVDFSATEHPLILENTIILKHSNQSDAEHSGRGIPNFLGSVALSPDGLSAWIPSKQDNIKRGTLRDGRVLTHDSAVRSVTSRIDLVNEEELTHFRVDHDNGGIASAAIFGRYGTYVFVALEGSRQIEVIDTTTNEPLLRFDSGGHAPQGLALSPDGLSLFVHNYMDRSIAVFDLHDLVYNQSNSVSLQANYDLVENERLAADVFHGKQLFYDSKDERLSAEKYSSCAQCHNEGISDGRVWDMSNFGEGLRNTISLVGHEGAKQGPLHWSANFNEVQDFEIQIRGLSLGEGLISNNQFHLSADPSQDIKKGLSSDMDDLAKYVESLNKIPASPYKIAGQLTENAKRGEALFVEKGCNECHSGKFFTDKADNILHDIGTIKDTSGRRLNGTLTGINTPTLRGLWMTAPYLHDGSAKTLQDAIKLMPANTTIEERNLIAEYLLQIDEDTSIPSAFNNNGSGNNSSTSNGSGGGTLPLQTLLLLLCLIYIRKIQSIFQ